MRVIKRIEKIGWINNNVRWINTNLTVAAARKTVRLQRKEKGKKKFLLTHGGNKRWRRPAGGVGGGGGGWLEKIKDPFTITMRSCDGVTVSRSSLRWIRELCAA